ncbi:ATP-binding protein [Frankia sp. CH37]|nr:ATP-binding protein [Parafrankia sp. CH37]
MLVYLRTTPGADGLAAALSACRRAGRRALGLDLSAPGLARVADPAGGRTGSGDVGAGEDGGGEIGMGSGSGSGAVPAADRFGGVAATLAVAVREARLSGAVLVAGPTGMLDPAARGLVVRAAAGGDGTLPPLPVVLYGRGAWDPETPGPVPLIDDVLALGADAQAAVWAAELGAPMPGELASLRLAPRQVRRAVAASRLSARVLEGGPEHDSPELQEPQPSPVPPELQAAPAARAAAPPRVEWLVAAARAQNATGLERLARRISPAVGWDDLVLPPRTLTTLRHLAGRAAHRGRVLDDWGLRRGGGRGEAVTALFVGESGTGKTMAAEVVAGALGVDMYVIDLSGVVDKYIGETEKNLERIFVGAEGLNAVLFFDEADALFGKRSEVSDARDRYANVEVAYLLQRIESFDGVAVLATNLAANLDDAFRRRLSVVAEFTRPDAEQRLALWRRMLAGVPLATDVDLEFCAKAFGLAGGDIRNAAVTAAYLGAANGQVVDMREIVTAVALEYRKLGRLCLADEFGPYFGLVPR